MITFWLVCGLFIVIALAFVLPPLLQSETQMPERSRETNLSIYRDQLSELETDLQNRIISNEQYLLERDAVQRRMLEDVAQQESRPSTDRLPDRQAAYVLAIAIPVLALGLYFRLGNVNARPPQPPVALSEPNAGESSGGMSQAQIEANVAALAKRLETNPGDLEGWIMLARSYGVLENYSEASKAYERAVALKPRDPELITNYAFALAMANGRSFDGRPKELIQQALQIAPENPTVLGLAGGAAFEQKEYQQAIEYWTKLLKFVPAESEMARAVSEKLSEARSLAAGGGK